MEWNLHAALKGYKRVVLDDVCLHRQINAPTLSVWVNDGEWKKLSKRAVRLMWKNSGSKSFCQVMLRQFFGLNAVQYQIVKRKFNDPHELSGIYSKDNFTDFIFVADLPRLLSTGNLLAGASLTTAAVGGMYLVKRRHDRQTTPEGVESAVWGDGRSSSTSDVYKRHDNRQTTNPDRWDSSTSDSRTSTPVKLAEDPIPSNAEALISDKERHRTEYEKVTGQLEELIDDAIDDLFHDTGFVAENQTTIDYSKITIDRAITARLKQLNVLIGMPRVEQLYRNHWDELRIDEEIKKIDKHSEDFENTLKEVKLAIQKKQCPTEMSNPCPAKNVESASASWIRDIRERVYKDLIALKDRLGINDRNFADIKTAFDKYESTFEKDFKEHVERYNKSLRELTASMPEFKSLCPQQKLSKHCTMSKKMSQDQTIVKEGFT